MALRVAFVNVVSRGEQGILSRAIGPCFRVLIHQGFHHMPEIATGIPDISLQ